MVLKPSTILLRAQKKVNEGKMKQIRGQLSDGKCGFCAAGVLEYSHTGEKRVREIPSQSTRTHFKLREKITPPKDLVELSSSWEIWNVITCLNDRGWSFGEIANWLKKIGY